MASSRVVLKFPSPLVGEPITWRLVKDFDLSFNILRASITDEEGLLVLGLTGEQDNLDRGLEWVVAQGVTVQPLAWDVVRNEDDCPHCGACINICPSGALSIDLETRRVAFDPEQCIACELCVTACPYQAMRVSLQ